MINEATKKANNWAEYVATGKDNTSKTLRKKIQIKWSLVAGNDKLYPEKSDVSYSPGNFDNTYDGWVKWYKACSASPKAMSFIGKSANESISPSEMITLYTKMIPFKLADDFRALIKSTEDGKLVRSFIDGDSLSTGQEERVLAVFAKIADTPTMEKEDDEEDGESSFGTAQTKKDDDDDEKSPFGNDSIVDTDKQFESMNEKSRLDESIEIKRWKRLAGI